MLQLNDINKQYVTGTLTQTALSHVSLNLRDSEFVAILGPSGSGKTTLLNVIGGLDRYDSGNLTINGISTKAYSDRDWDAYRNHTVGFVFQSYNLIAHQSILANVELALTISGVKRSERRKRAMEALKTIGLEMHAHKRPNQLSGGQMQRVAIARALINNPDILLADEPTGALDSATSIQVMELLRQVAKNRLVVMVTHNPDLAKEYATRIVKLQDGAIADDSNPYQVDTAALAAPQHKSLGKASMSFPTAISLSFNNLRTKKGRTLLTSFAGSIGIIGIALILSLSTGVNTYIGNLQKSTMSSYPIAIERQTNNVGSIMSAQRSMLSGSKAAAHESDGIYASSSKLSDTASQKVTNNLTAFKAYLDNPNSEIHRYLGESGIVYSYDTSFSICTYDPDGELVTTQSASNSSSVFSSMASMTGASVTGNTAEMLPGQGGSLISSAITDGYDLLCGAWPETETEIVLMLNDKSELSARTLRQLGLITSSQYDALSNESTAADSLRLSYESVIGKTYALLPDSFTYVQKADGTFACVSGDPLYRQALLDSAMQLTITGVVCPNENAAVTISGALGYTKALTDAMIAATLKSPVVAAQQATPTVNVLTGLAFAPQDDDAKIADLRAYLAGLDISVKASLCRELFSSSAVSAAQLTNLDETQLAAALDSCLATADRGTLLSLHQQYLSSASLADNLTAFGVVDVNAPVSISLYADSFEGKDALSACIDRYNAAAAEGDAIIYTDYVSLLMSSVTTIVNIISYVLIAFVAVSLVVSSIMIGIITYISVLERTKEIGILRALGASKRNISQVFNAETFIIGLCAGLIGVGLTELLLFPVNALIHALSGFSQVNAALPVLSALLLIVLSMGLTLIGGLIPAKKAAKKDPVTALRSE